jgi:hypothetical protein
MSETPGVYNVGDGSPFKQKSPAELAAQSFVEGYPSDSTGELTT